MLVVCTDVSCLLLLAVACWLLSLLSLWLCLLVSTVAAGSGRSAVASGRGASGLWEYLSHVVGVAWWCSSNNDNDNNDAVNSVLSQFLPSFMSVGHGSSHGGNNNGNNNGNNGGNNGSTGNNSNNGNDGENNTQTPVNLIQEREHVALASRVSLMSDTVQLLRTLLNHQKWKQPLSDCIGKAMQKCMTQHREWVQWVQRQGEEGKGGKGEEGKGGKGGGKEEEVFHRGRLSQLDIGGAITSLYVLGGMMAQQPHIGMPVRVHHRRHHVS